MRMTKIVCTIGPSSGSRSVIRELIKSGMNVARLNFSHGTHKSHLEKIGIIREISGELGLPVAILQDLAGPKIRVGRVPEPGIRLQAGDRFILTSRKVPGNKEMVTVSYAGLPEEVETGQRILLADGTMELIVKKKSGEDIVCEVVTGGVLTSHKGINLPDGTVQTPSLTDKDRKDLRFGLENGVDYVALSFVRTAKDITEVKEIALDHKRAVPVIAKIEKHEGVENIDEVIEAAEGIMVARGDLGVEIPLEDVPNIQKILIRKANAAGKPVITATQMLRSMVDSPRPTRAEATDVANAVLDGTDAVMLSEETATGKYPVESVKFMVRIIKSAEERFPHEKYLRMVPQKGVAESVAHASCVLADHLQASAIIATTRSGRTAELISRYRPNRPIIALSPNKDVLFRLSLFWGCFPHFVGKPRDTDDMIEAAVRSSVEMGVASKGELVVITAGHPLWVPGTTNMVQVRRI